MESLVKQLFEKRQSALPADETAVFRGHLKYKTRPDMGELEPLFEKLSEGFTVVYVTVDGVEEWSRNDQRLLDFLVKLPRIRLLVTCRMPEVAACPFPRTTDCLSKPMPGVQISTHTFASGWRMTAAGRASTFNTGHGLSKGGKERRIS